MNLLETALIKMLSVLRTHGNFRQNKTKECEVYSFTASERKILWTKEFDHDRRRTKHGNFDFPRPNRW